ncbi:MAG: aminotransferase class I/II-fold pyridoxal phosphate-dependent enzyme [Oscillospiraceae bacterium]|nr:aminotransferase class I/II-fold pyridoxal phosphate-dependent enzyme [Oscillospiraceae bacterium]
MNYTCATKSELQTIRAELENQYKACCTKGLKLDMSRGKPSAKQLDLSLDMLTSLSNNDILKSREIDTRNYGLLTGIIECRELFAQLFEVPVKNVIAGGSSSLTMMYDTIMRLWVFGAPQSPRPWSKEEKVKWLCPVPGYDRHFAICQQLGIEMINVPMTEDVPDMDMVEKLVADESVKGIWCVPKYSNPEGRVYSDECVRRLASMKTAAPDFRIFWDNAYVVHHLTDERPFLLNMFYECCEAGNADRVLMFTSTSKITYAGAGVAAMACSDANVEWTKKIMTVQAIGPDKINQLRHSLFFPNAAAVEEHMKKHALLLKPKFDTVIELLERELGGLGIADWTTPKGGYFISFNSLPGCAKRIHKLCADAGVVLTNAGATFPYGIDPEDKNIRIAPSLPPVEELYAAMEVFCICTKLAAAEKLLEN